MSTWSVNLCLFVKRTNTAEQWAQNHMGKLTVKIA